MKKIYINLNSNKGFTIQDLIIAISIFVLFSTLIGTLFVSIYKIQVKSQVQEIITLYAVQILEYIDKISYDDVNEQLATNVKKIFKIPSSLNITINIENYEKNEQETYIKKVRVNIEHNKPNSEHENIAIVKLKIKEI